MNMHPINDFDAFIREIARNESRRRFYHDPLKWIWIWMLGKIIYLVSKGIPLALFIWYYEIFLPKKDQ